MSHGIYMDVHVPAAITDGLRRAGIDVLTAQDDGTTRFTDEDLLHRATQHGRLLFTQDEDLLKIAAVWQLQSRMFSGIVYAHQLGPGNWSDHRRFDAAVPLCGAGRSPQPRPLPSSSMTLIERGVCHESRLY
jgi:hypothetical protein